MPKQNRVTPWGEIIAVPDRGMFMGNRGTLHDAHGQLTSQRWTRKAWVTCQLSFKGRQRQVMAPGKYTELFFLDEATGLAAGHRPCATCRRDNYSRFTELWVETNANRLGLANPAIKDIDNTLHQERFISGGWQGSWHPSPKDLPDGTFVVLDDPSTAWLVWGNELLEWSPDGYHRHIKRPDDQTVTVLTPRSIVSVLAAGYVPELHPSAGVGLSKMANEAKESSPRHIADKTSNTRSKAMSPKPDNKPLPVTAPTPAGTLYKSRKTPAGKALFAYTAAILKVTGMDQGNVYPLKKFLGNFSGHVQAGRIQKESGGYQLTPAGINYFNDRYNPGNPQHVDQSEVEAMVRLIHNGGGSDWVPIG